MNALLARTECVGLALKNGLLARCSLGRVIVDLLLWPSDIAKLISLHMEVLGCGPKLFIPRTFNDKIQQVIVLMPLRRNRRHVQFADKLAVRSHVADVVGSQYLPHLYWTGDDLRSARKLDLPRKFVVKTNQGSGSVLVVPDVRQLDWDNAHAATQYWLRHDHSEYYGEWQYRWIVPRIFIEEFLEDEAGSMPVDWKFFCFGGKVRAIYAVFGRSSRPTMMLFDRNFNLLPVSMVHPRHRDAIERPKCLEEMLTIAEKLAVGERFVRVDLYDVGRPVFGEMTLTPMTGAAVFDPPEWDLMLGALMG